MPFARRRRPDRARRPRIRHARCRARRCPRLPPPPTGTVTITARLRDSEPVAPGKEPFRAGRCPAGVLDQHRSDRRGDRRPAGRFVPAAGRRPARRSRRDPRCPTSTRGRSCPTASSGSRSASSRRSAWATSSTPRSRQRRREKGRRTPRDRDARRAAHHRGEARRPLRQAALTTDREHRGGSLNGTRQPHRAREVGRRRAPGRRRASAGSRVGARTASARPAARRARRRTTPPRRPRWGWGGARRRAARPRSARAGATDHGCAHRHEQPRRAGRQVVGDVIESCCGPTESGVARRAVADHRVQGVGAAVHQQRRAPRRPPPTTAAPPARRRCSRRPTPPRRGSVPRRRATAGSRPHSDGSRPPGAVDIAGPEQTRHLGRRCGPATSRPARRTSPPPSPQPSTPARAAPARSAADAQRAERTEQRAGVQHPRAARIGVGQPFQSRCAAAEHRHRDGRDADRRAARRRRNPPRCPPLGRDVPAQTPRQRLTRWSTRFHEAGSTATPAPGDRSDQSRRSVASCGKRDHATGVTGCWLRRAGKPGGQRQRLQASVQARTDHGDLPGRGYVRHGRRPGPDSRRGRQGAQTRAVDDVKSDVLQRV